MSHIVDVVARNVYNLLYNKLDDLILSTVVGDLDSNPHGRAMTGYSADQIVGALSGRSLPGVGSFSAFDVTLGAAAEVVFVCNLDHIVRLTTPFNDH